MNLSTLLQQYLPFTVLKLYIKPAYYVFCDRVATVLTVYGIETLRWCQPFYFHRSCNSTYRLRYWNRLSRATLQQFLRVATVLTVYGIETCEGVRPGFDNLWCCNSTYRLRYWNGTIFLESCWGNNVATVLTVYGIETYYANQYQIVSSVATVLTVYGIETRLIKRCW